MADLLEIFHQDGQWLLWVQLLDLIEPECCISVGQVTHNGWQGVRGDDAHLYACMWQQGMGMVLACWLDACMHSCRDGRNSWLHGVAWGYDGHMWMGCLLFEAFQQHLIVPAHRLPSKGLMSLLVASLARTECPWIPSAHA